MFKVNNKDTRTMSFGGVIFESNLIYSRKTNGSFNIMNIPIF